MKYLLSIKLVELILVCTDILHCTQCYNSEVNLGTPKLVGVSFNSLTNNFRIKVILVCTDILHCTQCYNSEVNLGTPKLVGVSFNSLTNNFRIKVKQIESQSDLISM